MRVSLIVKVQNKQYQREKQQQYFYNENLELKTHDVSRARWKYRTKDYPYFPSNEPQNILRTYYFKSSGNNIAEEWIL